MSIKFYKLVLSCLKYGVNLEELELEGGKTFDNHLVVISRL